MDTILQVIAFVFLAVILAISLSCTEATTKAYIDAGPTSAEQVE